MSKYINAEKLKKFLTERYEVCPISDDERHGRHCAIIEIQNFIDFLQQEQPEVDLEKEIKDIYSRDTSTLKTRTQYARLARHFAEWGAIHLNVRKEE